MKYFPTEISSKAFDKKIMGYDPEQVSHFLNSVAMQMDSLLRNFKALEETLKTKELELHEYKDRENSLRSAITQTTQITDKLKEEAERECKLIIMDAQKKAELITHDANDSLRKIYQEISELKKSKMQFEANLKAVAQAHLSLLDHSDQYIPRMKLQNLDLE